MSRFFTQRPVQSLRRLENTAKPLTGPLELGGVDAGATEVFMLRRRDGDGPTVVITAVHVWRLTWPLLVQRWTTSKMRATAGRQ